MSSKKKVFITGGAGFIGSLLACKFINHGWDVVAYDDFRSFVPVTERGDYPRHLAFRMKRIQEASSNHTNGRIPFTLIEGDIGNLELLHRSMAEHRPDVVIHLAAISIADASKRCFEAALSINHMGTTNVLNAARDCDASRFVYASSSMTYGDFVRFPADEEHPTVPLEIYGATKLCGEIMLKTYHEMFGLPYVIVRPCSVYGPTDTNLRIVQRFLECAVADREITLFDQGLQVLDFTYVEDAAQAFFLAATHPNAINETFNMTSGVGRTLRELADIVRRAFPSLKVKCRDSADPVRRTRRGAMDIAKARRMLGYEPQTMLERGVQLYTAYYQQQSVLVAR